MFKPAAALLALATAVTARKCQNLSIPISISATNTAFNLPPPATEIDVTNILIGITQDRTNFFNSIVIGVSSPVHLQTNNRVWKSLPNRTKTFSFSNF